MSGGELLLLSTKGRRSGRVWTNPLLFVREAETLESPLVFLAPQA
jgi:hypothetical protein